MSYLITLVLEQNHNAFDEYNVLQTTLMGNTILYKIKKEMDDLYAKTNFSGTIGQFMIYLASNDLYLFEPKKLSLGNGPKRRFSLFEISLSDGIKNF